MAIRLHCMKLPKGILPGPLYNPDNMLKCLEWIKEKSKDKIVWEYYVLMNICDEEKI